MGILINAKTKVVGLFGHPVAHSISPMFMNYTLDRLGLNYKYLAFDIKENNLKSALASAKALGFRGINITIPYKSIVQQYLDEAETEVQTIGAVNCIVNREGFLHGANTDHYGFIQPLKDRGFCAKNKKAFIIGCGGAARSVVYALIKDGIESIYLTNRTKKNALQFIEWCKKSLNYSNIIYMGDNIRFSQDSFRESNIIINSTPVGMYPENDACPIPEEIQFHKSQIVYDLIYNPPETVLLKRARNNGATTINGFEMLIVQGLFSLVLWFPEKRDEIFSIQKDVVTFAESV